MQIKIEILGATAIRQFVVRITATANNGNIVQRVRKCTQKDLEIVVNGGEVETTAFDRFIGDLNSNEETRERETVANEFNQEWSNGEPFEPLYDVEPEPEQPSNGAEGTEENENTNNPEDGREEPEPAEPNEGEGNENE